MNLENTLKKKWLNKTLTGIVWNTTILVIFLHSNQKTIYANSIR